MANLMLAPVWSMGWKVAIIVILAFLLLLCVALAVYIIVTHRRAKRREVEDDFDLPDDGGFSKIVRAEDYGVTMPPDYSLSAERMRTHSEVQHIQTGGGYVNAAPLGQNPAPYVGPIAVDPASGLPVATEFGIPAGVPVIPIDGVTGKPLTVDPARGYVPATVTAPYGNSSAVPYGNPSPAPSALQNPAQSSGPQGGYISGTPDLNGLQTNPQNYKHNP